MIMVIFITERYKQVKEMEEAQWIMLMEISMMAIGKIIRRVDKV
jgi:hypothetical protein